MRNMNCRNIRREIEEAGPGEAFGSEVNYHLTNCSTCATLARQQANLNQIVSSLGTIEAPGDFDFRLRARLAADKRQPRPFAFMGFSFGLRSAAMAMMLILAGAAILFVALRTRPDNSVPPTVAGAGQNPNSPRPAGGPVPGSKPSSDVAPPTTVASGGQGIDKTPVPAQLPVRRRVPRQNMLAANRDKRSQSRDESSTGATVLRDDQLAGAAFPIDASYQSLKVSIDDGRGSSRTISLPTVSFGSQRALSQGETPLMASARGAW